MNNIENTYINYDDVLAGATPEVIEQRIAQINQELLDFIEINELDEYVYVNQMSLTHAIMDYFSDIQRIKAFEQIIHVNETKIKAYETFWLLQRKPIQLKKQIEDDSILYVNEKFLLARLTSFMLGDDINVPLVGVRRKAFKNFLDTLYYSLKFRECNPQTIELMLLAFKAGLLIHGDFKNN